MFVFSVRLAPVLPITTGCYFTLACRPAQLTDAAPPGFCHQVLGRPPAVRAQLRQVGCESVNAGIDSHRF
jgi:hypothetical protein